MQVTAHANVAEAVRGADIITHHHCRQDQRHHHHGGRSAPACTSTRWGDCPGKTELHANVLARSSVFVEYEPQTRIRGDIQQMPANFAVTELWWGAGRPRTGAVSGPRSPSLIQWASRWRTTPRCAICMTSPPTGSAAASA